MRLTLRTLLAYLDDTLEPLEIRAIGQKVAESESTQELIARIKQVTRRRRITTPPATGPNSFEPNMVAEYLDNELSPEQVAELEKICLESDVHLAEIASCHQILTLVLGEPAVVPQTAKERMYGLVHGREARPSRKAAAGGHTSVHSSADADADEMFLLGLPFYRRSSWLRWALPLAAVLLIAIVGVALWQTIHGVDQPTTNSYTQATPTQPKGKDVNPPANPPAPADNNKGKNSSELPTPAPAAPDGKQSQPTKVAQSDSANGSKTDVKPDNPPSTAKPDKTPEQTAAAQPTGRKAATSKERAEIGQYYIPDIGPKSLLVQYNEKNGWSRLKPNARLYTSDQLLSLPGYASEVRLDNGIHLLLRGHLREFTPQLLVRVKNDAGEEVEVNEAAPMDYLQESTVVLHKPKDTDVDLTLLRGRLYLSNSKANGSRGSVVRLRFENKVWDLTLYPEAEVLVDLFKSRLGGTGDVRSTLGLSLLKGEAGLALEGERYPDLSDPGQAQFYWFSNSPDSYLRPQLSPQQLASYQRVLFAKNQLVDTKEAQTMVLALKSLRDRMTVDKPPQVALQEMLAHNSNFAEHQLALNCLAALDEVKDLLDVLGKADVLIPDRAPAITAMRRWLDHGNGQSERLFDPKTEKGLLRSELGYTTEEAKRIVALLRDPHAEDLLNSKYYSEWAEDLSSDKVAVAELARWRLFLTAQRMFHVDLPTLNKFNAAWPQDRRIAARKEVEQAIRDGKLPPPEPGKQQGPAGGKQSPKR